MTGKIGPLLRALFLSQQQASWSSRREQVKVRQAITKILFLLALCAGCMQPKGPWTLDAIAADDPTFCSTRLTYDNPTHHEPWRLEFLHFGNDVGLFLNLLQFPWDSTVVSVRLQCEDDPPLEETLPLFEGGMRLRFSETMTQQFTRALQDGKKVSILVNGVRQTLLPDDHFTSLYEQLMSHKIFSQSWLKGPLE